MFRDEVLFPACNQFSNYLKNKKHTEIKTMWQNVNSVNLGTGSIDHRTIFLQQFFGKF